jgi:outer membrane protein TolC
MIENRKKYDASLDIFRAASRTYRAAAEAYRARTIGDDEFLLARNAFNAAQIAADAAEADYLASL